MHHHLSVFSDKPYLLFFQIFQKKRDKNNSLQNYELVVDVESSDMVATVVGCFKDKDSAMSAVRYGPKFQLGLLALEKVG